MSQFLSSFFNSNYMPHGHCYFWQPHILWTNVVSDLVIAIAYFSIPIAISLLAKRRPDMEFKGIFILFALFIWCCGLTHLFSIYTIWSGVYGLHGIIKAVTAVVSALTAFVLFRNFSTLLAIPTPEQHKAKIEEAILEKERRNQLEQEHKAEAIYKFAIELLPTGLLVINQDKNIILSNQALANVFGYQTEELIGKPVSALLPQQMTEHHNYLVDSYLRNPAQRYAMASGRAVRGKAKDGHEVTIEISLSSHKVDGEPYAFASVIDFDNQSIEKSLQQESNNRIKRAIEASNDGIWEWNISNQAVWFSPRFLNLIGQETDSTKLTIDAWFNHIHPEDHPLVKQAINQHISAHKKFDIVYRGLVNKHEYQWLHARGNTLFDDQDKPLLMSGILTNINDLKTLEQELAHKSQFLNQLLDKSLCGLYVYNIKKQRIVFTNPEFTKITGYTGVEIKQIPLRVAHQEIVHRDSHSDLDRHFAEVIDNQASSDHSIQVQIRHKSGHWIWILLRNSSYSFDAQGNPNQILGTFFEITDLKNREEKIKSLALDFSTTFEQAAVGIAHVGLDGKLLKANHRLCEILGYDFETLKSETLEEITIVPDRELDAPLIEELKLGLRDNFAIEKRFLKANGTTIWTNVTVSIVCLDNLEQSHFIYVVEDISKRKRMEKALADSNASLEQFAYSASHDLQEPLRKISAFSDSIEQRLRGKLEDPDAIYELDRISDAAHRMRDMINSLLQLSRYTRTQVVTEAVKFSELMQLAIDDLSELIKEHQAQVNFSTEDPTLWVDRNGIQQVFRNLITNSIRYKSPDRAPQIHISCNEKHDHLELVFEDNGLGINPDSLEQIFEPFHRLVGRDIPGSGMGLALCRQIVHAHGGTIKAQSMPEKGAIFIVELPKKPDSHGNNNPQA